MRTAGISRGSIGSLGPSPSSTPFLDSMGTLSWWAVWQERHRSDGTVGSAVRVLAAGCLDAMRLALWLDALRTAVYAGQGSGRATCEAESRHVPRRRSAGIRSAGPLRHQHKACGLCFRSPNFGSASQPMGRRSAWGCVRRSAQAGPLYRWRPRQTRSNLCFPGRRARCVVLSFLLGGVGP